MIYQWSRCGIKEKSNQKLLLGLRLNNWENGDPFTKMGKNGEEIGSGAETRSDFGPEKLEKVSRQTSGDIE